MVQTVVEWIAIISYIAIFWMFFTKAGKPGWYSLIPGFSFLAMGKLVKKTVSGAIAGLASLLILILTAVILLQGANGNTSKVTGVESIAGLLVLVWYLAFLFMLIGLTKAYDKKGGYWVLFVFFPYIAVFLTNSAHYIGGGAATRSASQTPTSLPTQPSA